MFFISVTLQALLEAVKIMEKNREILSPNGSLFLVPETRVPVWTYIYKHPLFTLAVATVGTPGSEKLSLGGFRIVPRERADIPGFDPVKEAIRLADGMEEKVFWSRAVRIAGPQGKEKLSEIVGGKCVLLPKFRVGEEGDFEVLAEAAKCLKDFENHAKINIVTGQDLGHGIMSDGKTSSLEFLHSQFQGSVLEDTSKPTGEGNFYILKGMLEAEEINLPSASVGLIGCGNVGEHVLWKLLGAGAKVFVVERSEEKRRKLEQMNVKAFRDKESLFSLPLDAICVNASGGTLDDYAVDQICDNGYIKIVCGSENLAMPNPDHSLTMLACQKIYAPTELCGMMGYLTAVEEYLCRKNNVAFDVNQLFEASKRLSGVGYFGVRVAKQSGFKVLFEEAVRDFNRNYCETEFSARQ